MNRVPQAPAVWFPAIRANTGTDVFTRRLCDGLSACGIRAEIKWLPHRAEYAPWSVPVPKAPPWATVAHVNTWLHPRFIPPHLPVVATLHHSVHDPALRPYKGWLRAAYHRWWIAPVERRVLRRAQRVVAVSRFVADMACRTLDDVPMEVIHNGIDVGRFQHLERQQRRPGRPFRLLFVGSWMMRKGVDLLAPIMRELGDGFELHYTGGAAAAADSPAMPPNMHDIGRQSTDGVVAAMQQADAFLFPSRSEGLPLVAAEAMACGLPVIATRGSSLPEVVEDGVTGLLCARDDVGAFATAARRLADAPGLAATMSAAAPVVTRRRFDLAVMVESYATMYALLAGQANQRR